MKIVYTQEAWQKIMYFVNKCPDEISGFGTVLYDKSSNEFIVTDAYLLEQTGGAAHTDIDGKSLSKMMVARMKEEGSMKLWWHSHVNMAAFWSGQDTSTIKELGTNGWIIATVFNKRREYKSAYCGKVTHESGHTGVDLREDISTELYVSNLVNDAELEAEYKENFKEKVYPKFTANYGYDYDWKMGQKEGKAARKKAKKEQSLLTDYTDDYFNRFDGASYQERIDMQTAIEAQALGMSVYEYDFKIMNGTRDEIDAIQSKLALLGF